MPALTKNGALLLAGALMLGAATAAAQSTKVGYINVVRLEKESPMAARATEMLKQEFEPRRLQVQELQKRVEAARERMQNDKDRLAPAEAQARSRELSEMTRKSEQMFARFAEDLEVRRGELRARFLEEIDASVKAVAEAGKFDLILQKVAFVRPGIDVTPLVLKEMAKRGSVLR